MFTLTEESIKTIKGLIEDKEKFYSVLSDEEKFMFDCMKKGFEYNLYDFERSKQPEDVKLDLSMHERIAKLLEKVKKYEPTEREIKVKEAIKSVVKIKRTLFGPRITVDFPDGKEIENTKSNDNAFTICNIPNGGLSARYDAIVLAITQAILNIEK